MGNNSFVSYCARKRQLQVVPSCARCRHISPLIALVPIRATDPVAIYSIVSIRVNACNSWAKKIFPNNSWAIIHSFPIAPAKDNFKLSQVVPVVVISSPHCISANSCDRPGRHFNPLQPFVSIRVIRGQKKFPIIRGNGNRGRSPRKKQLQ